MISGLSNGGSIWTSPWTYSAGKRKREMSNCECLDEELKIAKEEKETTAIQILNNLPRGHKEDYYGPS